MTIHRIMFFIFALSFSFFPTSGFSQEKSVNQKRIEKEREKKQKKAHKEYQDAVKKHKKKQSETTKASMKRTRKEASKMTPIRR